ncbi:DUF707 domain-containing protein [Bradyrhizobium sp. sBnM-33]|uniref:DUF707 domain-containing protein n=1 Tax=Bradyrhizobium sp. sBnM-33 TaxID=2831780 RepID=UPI001BCCBE55|nr:DUF707 domain-containing protein [Bradyrhizobium sp. sBnM-33]WOH53672.1 DUF707 domain-containing protein [Bradyrhizobium sp. sBnM-33]
MELEGSGSKRDLVFARVGKGSLHRNWAPPDLSNRNWDLQLSTYLDDNAAFTQGDFPLSVDRGTKWDSVFRFFRDSPGLLDQYEYVFFPDDDLVFQTGDIGRIFGLCRHYNLYIAQPALDPSSYYSHPILLKCPAFKLRFINYIEPMAPCIKASYLRDLLPYVEKHFTGWGIDHIWALLMADPPFRAAVLDEVSVVHTRPFETGAIYASFKAMKADPRVELKEVMELHGSELVGMVVYGGVLRGGGFLGGPSSRIVNGLSLLASSFRARNAQTFRTAMGSLLRAATMMDYRPRQLRAAKDGIGEGRTYIGVDGPAH